MAKSAREAVITASALTKTYTPRGGGPVVEAVKGIDFSVIKGTCTGLLGPNGAGKSTTMKMLMGLTRRSGGSLTIFGHDTADLNRAERIRISLVPQEDNLDPDLTVAENLMVYGMLFGIERSVLKERVPQLLNYMQLSEKADARVNQLSGGMKRRLTIGRALVNDPDLLFLDEPTTGLDPQARVMIWQRLCDHIIMIDHGKVLDEGTPKDLISRHVKSHVFDVSKPIPKSLPPEESEDVGDSVLFYVEDASTFRKALPEDATYLHRPANMEDVFLRLTGRKLRE